MFAQGYNLVPLIRSGPATLHKKSIFYPLRHCVPQGKAKILGTVNSERIIDGLGLIRLFF